MAQQAASPVEVTAREALELPAMLLAVCAGAIWGTAAGPLPGTGLIERFPVAGSALVAAAWLAGFAALARCYRSAVAAERLPRVFRRLALVQLITAAACVPATFPEQLVAFKAPYFKYLYLFAVAAGACALLLGPETRSLWRTAIARRSGAVAAGATITLASAAFAVGGVDLLLHVDGHWEQKYQLKLPAFAVNVGLLASIHAVLLALTARLGAALLLGTALYAALGFANLGKITYMHAAVHPLDLLYVAELVPQLGSTFGVVGTGALVAGAALIAVGVAASFRRRVPAPRWPWRAAALALAALPLLVPSFGQTYEPIRRSFAAAGIELKGWDSVLSARQNGVLLELLTYLPDVNVAEPAEYSAEAVQVAARRYDWRSDAPDRSRGRPATLIVYMIESLVDPRALGRPLSADPIPTIRALAAAHSSGYAVVPGRFGESASSEFELLTGMSTAFLPARSVAFKQYVKRPLPSLPCLLKKRGYRTVAVQADPIEFYNRREVYERLCFDRTRWLYEDPAAPRAPHGKAPADDAVVDAVIEEAAVLPAFVFAFPSSTHHPYNSDVFATAELDVLDPPPGAAARELKHYLNALAIADAAVGKLIAHFAAADQNVVIAVLGDHLPPLSADALSGFYEDVAEDGFERLFKEHSVPLVVWSNFEEDRENLFMSLNFLATYLLETAGVETEGFLRFVDRLDGRLSLLSRQVVGARGLLWTPETMPAPYRRLLDDYRLLQHDALFGRSYLASGLGAVLAGGADVGGESR